MARHNLDYKELSDFFSFCDSKPAEDFEGLWLSHWPNGQLKYRGYFELNHRKIGQHLSFWENGALQQLTYWDDGWPVGTFQTFFESGNKMSEHYFGEECVGSKTYAHKTYAGTHNIHTIRTWKDGNLTTKWQHPSVRGSEGPEA